MTTSLRGFRAWISHGGIGPSAVLLALLCGLTGLYSVRVGTDINWDLQNYHLYSAYAFLHGRLGLDIAPAQLQTYFNPLANLPIYGLVRRLNDHPRLVAFLMGLPVGVYAFALSGISLLMARKAFGPGRLAVGAAMVATLAGMTGAGVMPGIGMSSNDVTIAALVMLALWTVLWVADTPNATFRGTWKGSLLAGLLAGFALGLKLTNIIYAAPLGLAILAFLGLRHAMVAGGAMMLGFLMLWAPFALQLWREFGSPVFPLYNDIFASPDYSPIGLADKRFLPRSWTQTAFYPFYWLRQTSGLVTELQMRDARIAIGSLAALVLIVDLTSRRLRRLTLAGERSTLLLLAFCIISYVIWLQLFGIYRYLLVVESLSVVLTMLAIARLLAGQRRLGVVAFAATALAVTLFTIRPDWGHTPYGPQVVRFDPAPQLPSDSLVIFVGGEPMGYLVPFLPPGVLVVGIENNMLRPGQTHGLDRRTRTLIAGQRGALWAVADPDKPISTIERSLETYGLGVGECHLVRSNLAPAGHRFCELHRTGS